MILPDSNVWIYAFDKEQQPEHERAADWLSAWLPESDLLVPSIVETEVVHYLARQLASDVAQDAVDEFLAHPGDFEPLTPSVNRQAGEFLVANPDRGIGGRDAAVLVHAKRNDATIVTHDRALLAVARDWGLDAHDPVAPEDVGGS